MKLATWIATPGGISAAGDAMIGAYRYSIGITNMQTIAFVVTVPVKTTSWVTPRRLGSLTSRPNLCQATSLCVALEDSDEMEGPPLQIVR